MVLFALRPGQTYHEVEEVRYGGSEALDRHRRRIAISGWLHAAKPGEPGYSAEHRQTTTDNIERLHRMKSKVPLWCVPIPYWRPFGAMHSSDESDPSSLTGADLTFLSRYPPTEVLSPDFSQG